MPSFPKPSFSFGFDVAEEKNHLRQHKNERGVAGKSDNSLLLSTWNIANLGLQDRTPEHYELIAEIIGWFDLIALQEVNDNMEGLTAIMELLPNYYKTIFSDKAGNNERAAFIYDSRKVNLLEMVGEIGIPPAAHRYIKIKGVTTKFTGFDRNPYLCSFDWDGFRFMLINVHLYFGSDSKKNKERRALEAYAVSRYADLESNSKYAYCTNAFALGDFNLPKVDKDDPIYKALTARGLQLPTHSTKVYSTIASDSEYDQIAFLPQLKSMINNHGVFDYDSAVFPQLWETRKRSFKSYLRYYMSDHRPLWMELKR